jgi:polyphosphate glucokinase
MASVAIGVDVGGSSIKAAGVDPETGALLTDRRSVPLPQPSRPEAVVAAIAEIVESLAGELGREPVVGVDVPCVVQHGVTKSAANIDPGWIGFDAQTAIAEATGRRVWVVNDADAAGVAEVRGGAAKGRAGTVLVATLGTGFGSALVHDGSLVPNFELGHLEIRGQAAESRSAAAAKTRSGSSWEAWAADLDEHLRTIYRLMAPDVMVLGGGVSEHFAEFRPYLTVPCEVLPAAFLNDAGLIGAALLAVQQAEGAGVASVAGAGR